MFERSEPTPHYLLMTYGLSEIYYNENSHENEISKFGFELILRIDQIQILD
ncbi:suppressor of fused domain protein [Acinetobacter sp. ANC 3832]|uniref:suppressor of fused domain protein n=1 Tax=Acinetobacter sp. ANC 3832 TaxID=1977874 RepID=UPI00148ADB4D|nr:suppressor of fused domain protein [Acinetobacter sp. ANC 3832]